MNRLWKGSKRCFANGKIFLSIYSPCISQCFYSIVQPRIATIVMSLSHVYPGKCMQICLLLILFSIPGTAMPGLNLNASSDSISAYPGDTITCHFELLNTGNETLNDLTLQDDLFGNISVGKSVLGVGESCNATVSYLINESDLPRPLFDVARASARCNNGSEILSNDARIVVSLGVKGYENISRLGYVGFSQSNLSS